MPNLLQLNTMEDQVLQTLLNRQSMEVGARHRNSGLNKLPGPSLLPRRLLTLQVE